MNQQLAFALSLRLVCGGLSPRFHVELRRRLQPLIHHFPPDTWLGLGGKGGDRIFEAKNNDPMLNVYLIRHAESEGNVNHHLIGGQSNHLPLTKRGMEQAKLLGARLKEEALEFDAWWTSTAIRARHTAELVSEGMEVGADLMETPALLEVSQGKWEGEVRSRIYTDEVKAQFLADPLHFKAPDGESIQEVQTRMFTWLEQLTKLDTPEKNRKVAAFSHGFAIRCLMVYLMGAEAGAARRAVTD
ncbi:MAG: histidine phosphatase family protein, partial [Bacteroidota bacterium]